MTDWLGRNLRVRILCGHAGVSNAALVSASGDDLLIDCGDGTLQALVGRGFDWRRLAGLCITHGHFDHVGSFFALLGFLRMIGHTRPLEVLAPYPATEIEAFIALRMRTAPDGLPFALNLREAKTGAAQTVGAFSVTPFPAYHRGSTAAGIGELLPAVGYRIAGGEECVVFSGDTGISDDLRRAVHGADLAVLEATEQGAGQPEVHLSVAEAQEVGRTAKAFLLVHRMRGG